MTSAKVVALKIIREGQNGNLQTGSVPPFEGQ